MIFHIPVGERASGCAGARFAGVLVLVTLALGGICTAVHAEPWLSTRYAQNCAGCHAPDRKNLPPMGRRCTLSCQGCHVNPNGGGLRSQYGKWNENRWLRSFRSDLLQHKKSVAPVDKQIYGRRPWDRRTRKAVESGPGEEEEVKGPKGKRRKRRPAKRRQNRGGKGKGKSNNPGRAKLPSDGFPLVETNKTYVDEEQYERRGMEKIIASRKEFEYGIPKNDPYRLLNQQKTDAGGDVRWQWTRYARDDEDPTWNSFLMTADFGLRYRPFYKYLHLVYESRFTGSPADNTKYEELLLSADTRSLYAMVDNLPFNVFVMGGYYRPLFGNYVPDHYALAQRMMSFAMSGQPSNYNLLYNAASIGTAPNVPYLNVHLIRDRLGSDKDNPQGFAANTGLRFVTLGASLNYSYWRTTSEFEDSTTQVEMHSIHGAATYMDVILSLEAVSMARDVDTQDFRRGGVWTLRTLYRAWREIYPVVEVASANTTADLKPGSVLQSKAGVRSFLWPGVEVTANYYLREDKREQGKPSETKTSGFSGQFHLFF